MFSMCDTAIPGCYEVLPVAHDDERGRFVKIFHKDIFAMEGLDIQFAEEYYSKSFPNVVRGMHFQLPPHDHVKLVYCVFGQVIDVVVDLRVGSPAYGRYQAFNLSAEQANALYIPKGVAHGFLAHSGPAIMVYKVTTVYSPTHDSGILWNSFGYSWPVEHPILSNRDKGFIGINEFASPFSYVA